MARPKSQSIRVQRDGGILRLHLNRTDRYNAIDFHTLHELAEVLSEPRAEVLVIEGDGDAFSVGADIAELATFKAGNAAAYSRLGHDVIDLLERWPGVTVAHLGGYALGAGLELALGCDLLIGFAGLRLGLPGLAWAMVPCMGGLRRLSCRISSEQSSALFLNGDILDVDRAHQLGLIDRIALSAFEIERLCTDMGEFGPSAVHAIRDLRLRCQGRIDKFAEAELFSQPFASGECQRRLRALLAG